MPNRLRSNCSHWTQLATTSCRQRSTKRNRMIPARNNEWKLAIQSSILSGGRMDGSGGVLCRAEEFCGHAAGNSKWNRRRSRRRTGAGARGHVADREAQGCSAGASKCCDSILPRASNQRMRPRFKCRFSSANCWPPNGDKAEAAEGICGGTRTGQRL